MTCTDLHPVNVGMRENTGCRCATRNDSGRRVSARGWGAAAREGERIATTSLRTGLAMTVVGRCQREDGTLQQLKIRTGTKVKQGADFLFLSGDAV